MSEVSGYEDGNVLTHGGLANRKKRGRRPLDCPEEKKVFMAVGSKKCTPTKINMTRSLQEEKNTIKKVREKKLIIL